jgi:hypothetical protein
MMINEQVFPSGSAGRTSCFSKSIKIISAGRFNYEHHHFRQKGNLKRRVQGKGREET